MARRAPRYDIVLAVRRFSARDRDLHLLLRPLEARLDGTMLIGVDAYYRTRSDIALLVLQIDTRYVTGPLLTSIQRDIARGGASMFEVNKLSPVERDKFENRYLASQDVALMDLPTVADAVRLLAQRIGMRVQEPGARPRRATPPAVRFTRGQHWERGRLCRLSAEGVYIATGGPPRIGDRSQIEVIGPRGPVLANAITVQVTPPHAARALGQSGFAARFVFRDAAEQRALAPALAAVRDAVIGTAPPPRRKHTRFPVRWPAYLAQGTGTTSIRVLDISEGGLFAETSSPAGDGWVNLVVPYDERGAPMRLAARIARTIRPEARASGMAIGIGVELVDGHDREEDRYREFVERVARRAGMRIVVGADPRRLAQLVEELAGVGYAVSGASEPRVVYDRIVESQDLPNLVLIDESIEDGNIRAAKSLHRALSMQSVNMLHVDSEPPVSVRHLIDAALVA
jgi:hypothetical protein